MPGLTIQYNNFLLLFLQVKSDSNCILTSKKILLCATVLVKRIW